MIQTKVNTLMQEHVFQANVVLIAWSVAWNTAVFIQLSVTYFAEKSDIPRIMLVSHEALRQFK